MNTAKAHNRLKRASEAHGDLSMSDNFREFEDAWNDFLRNAKSVYIMLGEACKGKENSYQWFKRKNHERKHDELLNYLFHARDADEHTLEQVSEFEPGYTIYGVEKEGFSNHMTFESRQDGSEIARSLDGKPLLCEIHFPSIRLLPVKGRAGEIYDPPALHLGKPLENTAPANLAELCIKYLSKLIADAEKLA